MLALAKTPDNECYGYVQSRFPRSTYHIGKAVLSKSMAKVKMSLQKKTDFFCEQSLVFVRSGVLICQIWFVDGTRFKTPVFYMHRTLAGN
jgi:hypothetical protein